MWGSPGPRVRALGLVRQDDDAGLERLGVNEVELGRRPLAEEQGIAPYRIAGDGNHGLLFGYAGLNERTITEGIDLLAEVIAALRSR